MVRLDILPYMRASTHTISIFGLFSKVAFSFVFNNSISTLILKVEMMM
jgi:hypothetical protein